MRMVSSTIYNFSVVFLRYSSFTLQFIFSSNIYWGLTTARLLFCTVSIKWWTRPIRLKVLHGWILHSIWNTHTQVFIHIYTFMKCWIVLSDMKKKQNNIGRSLDKTWIKWSSNLWEQLMDEFTWENMPWDGNMLGIIDGLYGSRGRAERNEASAITTGQILWHL